MAPRNPECVLIHAPYGRDGAVIEKVLRGAGFTSQVCESIEAICSETYSGTGAVLIADEALRTSNVEQLSQFLKSQERWSDLPVIVLTRGGEATQSTRYRLRLLAPLGNVTLLERPLRTETVISAVETALRSRRRQYGMRDLLRSLRSANVELTATNKELEEFAYVASHDLQEPLRMIGIFTQKMIRELGDRADEETRASASFVDRGVRRMEALLRDLLAFSRVIHAESQPDQTANLGDALKDALSVLQNRVEETGATIAYNGLPEVLGNQFQFSHVFQNLVSNSLKYSKPGEPPRVVVSAQRDEKCWIVSVEDNGIGFEQEHAQRIFGLFKRLHRDEYPGTGVGLAICKRIVEKHGGTIWAESEPSRGSIFRFTVKGPHDI